MTSINSNVTIGENVERQTILNSGEHLKALEPGYRREVYGYKELNSWMRVLSHRSGTQMPWVIFHMYLILTVLRTIATELAYVCK